MTERLWKIFNRFLNGLAYFCGAMLLFMTFSICYEVLMRHILGKPTSWVVDFSSFILVYITFFAGAWVLKNDSHVKIEIAIKYFNVKAQTVVNTITSFLAMLACALFSWTALDLICSSYRSNSKFYGGVVVPEYIILGPVFFGSCLLSIMFAKKGWEYIQTLRLPPTHKSNTIPHQDF